MNVWLGEYESQLTSWKDRYSNRRTVSYQMLEDAEVMLQGAKRELSGSHRHLAYPGALVTWCGFSASHPEIWVANSMKPKCPTCSKVKS